MSFDPLDMNNYKVEKLPKMQKSSFEQWMARLGGPIAIIAFILLYWFVPIGFIDNLNPEMLTAKALKRYNEIGGEAFLRSNYAMFAIFIAGLILWMTEAIPNYLTSLLIILFINHPRHSDMQRHHTEGSPRSAGSPCHVA